MQIYHTLTNEYFRENTKDNEPALPQFNILIRGLHHRMNKAQSERIYWINKLMMSK